ncbi:putative membrane protein [Ehrlichia ruminantium]|uniref:Uncharacterized protein n=1 Tax=Ehrlichia ruminantium (strain Welgevonden) TaxID=254945 RepID=A0A0H3M0P9_EHRRW|nr:hypothetical protein [Ehrlichia ruminantium]KYW98710.1 hypothetical protein AUR40_05080 [Ehrlichia ruminantium]QLK50312.1 hypothetical protein FDZ68_01305 [Ehrlichia ruminantium]QLK51236.1 hypothetical protein FDZ66_01310 [Ehrlichia ruminantium]QLK52160.1 hypothetical protein FDZ65_01320 [Ehrlichia ruminantium]QLK53071.1 hypothetical protein FDZ64_01305 [Ehrlichia ruminantium]
MIKDDKLLIIGIGVIGIMAFIMIVFRIMYLIQCISRIRQGISLLKNNLLTMVNTADTTMKEVKPCCNDNVCFVVNGIHVGNLLISTFNDYWKKQDDPLVKKHMDYIRGDVSYNSKDEHDQMIRATMGAAFESIVIQDINSQPNMSLIHHTISYLYGKGYQDLLRKMICEIVTKKECIYMMLKPFREDNWADRANLHMMVRYDSHNVGDDRVYIDTYLLGFAGNESGIPSSMKLLISPERSDSRVLKYSSYVSCIFIPKDGKVKSLKRIRCESTLFKEGDNPVKEVIYTYDMPSFSIGQDIPIKPVRGYLQSCCEETQMLARTNGMV